MDGPQSNQLSNIRQKPLSNQVTSANSSPTKDDGRLVAYNQQQASHRRTAPGEENIIEHNLFLKDRMLEKAEDTTAQSGSLLHTQEGKTQATKTVYKIDFNEEKSGQEIYDILSVAQHNNSTIKIIFKQISDVQRLEDIFSNQGNQDNNFYRYIGELDFSQIAIKSDMEAHQIISFLKKCHNLAILFLGTIHHLTLDLSQCHFKALREFSFVDIYNPLKPAIILPINLSTLQKFSFGKFDFLDLKNCGLKTIKELSFWSVQCGTFAGAFGSTANFYACLDTLEKLSFQKPYPIIYQGLRLRVAVIYHKFFLTFPILDTVSLLGLGSALYLCFNIFQFAQFLYTKLVNDFPLLFWQLFQVAILPYIIIPVYTGIVFRTLMEVMDPIQLTVICFITATLVKCLRRTECGKDSLDLAKNLCIIFISLQAFWNIGLLKNFYFLAITIPAFYKEYSGKEIKAENVRPPALIFGLAIYFAIYQYSDLLLNIFCEMIYNNMQICIDALNEIEMSSMA